jgi:hypothetical protein
VANQTFEGAGGSVAIGLSPRARVAPFATLALALGPVLLLAIAGVVGRPPGTRWQASIVALAVGLLLFYCVWLTSEPIWVGWRAGQIVLVTAPPLIAAFFAQLIDTRRRRTAAVVAALALAVGVPTTVIDTWNAQDVEHLAMGPGFRWTVAVPPATQAAMRWIREQTPSDAVVQMSIGPRGRETWTLVPTFGARRMAAGRPISLLPVPEYDERSGAVDAMFRTSSASEASRLAHTQRIDYVYVDGSTHRGGPRRTRKARRTSTITSSVTCSRSVTTRENRDSNVTSVTITGAGVAGLTIAHQLVRQGFHVTVIEKNPVVGGLAGCFTTAIYFDVGRTGSTPRIGGSPASSASSAARRSDPRRSARMFGRYQRPLVPASSRCRSR